MEKIEYMQIKEVAQIFGVTVPTLRNWEKKGYLIPEITLPSGRKKYTKQQIESCIGKKRKGDRSNDSRGNSEN